MEKKIILITTILLAAYGCSRDPVFNCTFKSGDKVTEERQVEASFDKIHAYGRVDVQIAQGSPYKIEVSGGENQVREITANIEDGILTIDDESNCGALRDFKKATVFITLPEIREVGYYGNGIVTSADTLTADSFLADVWSGGDQLNLTLNTRYTDAVLHSGTCDLTLSGKTERMTIFKRGTGKIRAFDFKAKTAYIDSYSSTDTEVYITDELNYRIRYYGDIYLKGNPKTEAFEHSGDGRLILK